MLMRDRLFIGGHWVAPSTGETIEVHNAGTGEVMGRIPAAGEKDVDAAVAAARGALEGWSRTPPGPVLCIIPYKDEEDAIRIANDSPYGLAGAVWSRDEARAQGVARRIRAGQIDINGGAFNMNAPFGGFKQSGHGREARVYGLEEFLEYKSLQLKG